MKRRNVISGRAILNGNPNDGFRQTLLEVIAETSIWAPVEGIKPGPVYPGVKRGRPKDIGKLLNGVRIDDNTYAARAIGEAVSATAEFEDFEVWHIWPGTTYDERYHTLLQNLVMIPRALAALADQREDVTEMLKYRAWELYGWRPEGKEIPRRPEAYPSSWGAGIPDLSVTAGGSDGEDDDAVALSEGLGRGWDAEMEEEIAKVERRVPKWLKKPEQINAIILTFYMKLSLNGTVRVTPEQLRNTCESNGVEKFAGNYSQMKNFGVSNHAKVFSELTDGSIVLWEPISNFIRGLFARPEAAEE